ncbi:MAG: CopD family protein [Gammaproteobacteria bacterium]|nr:CopD family protein [Gammaproteobacteria bacterium]MDE2345223.1 CopD family protein [Gammaproteobacteria bacterium]
MLWILAFHIIFMVTWFAGLFYLPRLFVYHAEAHDETGVRRFEIMERRLFTIMTIGACGTVAFGLWLLFEWWWPAPPWLRLKLVCVAMLLLYHLYCWKFMWNFAHNRNRHPAKFYRWFNEAPGLLLVIIVVLVVVKPAL